MIDLILYSIDTATTKYNRVGYNKAFFLKIMGNLTAEYGHQIVEFSDIVNYVNVRIVNLNNLKYFINSSQILE